MPISIVESVHHPKGNLTMSIEEINAILCEIPPTGVEPIDDPNQEISFWDWAEVVGCVEDFVPDYDAWGKEIGE